VNRNEDQDKKLLKVHEVLITTEKEETDEGRIKRTSLQERKKKGVLYGREGRISRPMES
jgi:hypothetical protein